MILLDVNLLLYAYNPSFTLHGPARAWLQEVLSSPGPVCLAWTSILGFLRLSTSARSFEYPLSIEEAISIVAAWLARPNVAILLPGERHWIILRDVLLSTRVRGAGVMDAHLAALAIEHGATLCTTDRDFVRFQGVKLLNPLESGL